MLHPPFSFSILPIFLPFPSGCPLCTHMISIIVMRLNTFPPTRLFASFFDSSHFCLSVCPSYRSIYHLTISQGDLARDYLHLLPQSLSSTSGNLKGLIPIENFTHFFLPDSILGSTISFFQPSIFFTFTPGCHFPSFPSIGLLIGTFRFFFIFPIISPSVCLRCPLPVERLPPFAPPQ